MNSIKKFILSVEENVLIDESKMIIDLFLTILSPLFARKFQIFCI